VEKIQIYTPNKWKRYKFALQTSGEDTNSHSKQVEKIQIHTRNEWRRFTLKLETRKIYRFETSTPGKYKDVRFKISLKIQDSKLI
jgi:hypothetical protein